MLLKTTGGRFPKIRGTTLGVPIRIKEFGGQNWDPPFKETPFKETAKSTYILPEHC